MSIRTRIVLSYLLIIGVGFFLLVKRIVDAKEIKPRYMESVEEPMVDMARVLAAFLEAEVKEDRIDPHALREAFGKAGGRSFVAQIYAMKKTSIDLQVYVTDARGVVIFDSDGGKAEGRDYSRWNDVYLTLHGQYGSRSSRSDPADPTSSILYVAAPIMEDGHLAGVLTLGKPQRSMAVFMTETRRRIAVMGAIAAGLVVVIGSVFSTWLTRPILRLTRYAEAVRDGRRVSLPKLGSSEIATLGKTIEDMRAALEGRRYVESYVQTLTHEVKSPVSAIRGAAELLHEPMPPEQQQRFLANIEVEAERIQEIVDRLLLLSSTEARNTLEEKAELHFEEVVRRAMASVEAAAASREIHCQLQVSAKPSEMEGDAFLLEKAVLNLLQNALAFAPRRSDVMVVLDGTNLTVRDSGPGIPAYALPRVFERFFSLPRPESGKKSSGLGLAFVREVAALHGGTVTLENAAGGGATATLKLPPRAIS